MLELIDKGRGSTEHPVPLLFVHGGWHAAWCWNDHFLDFFAENGFRAVAVSLRGHGNSVTEQHLNTCTISDYVDDVRAAADLLDGPPVVIGHSMGGYVVQQYLSTCDAPAGVLMASAPPHGVREASIRMMRRHPWAVFKSNTFGSTHDVVRTPRLVRGHLFCRQTPQNIVDKCMARLQPESALAMRQMLTRDRVRADAVSAPLLVLGASEDGAFIPEEVAATARAYRTNAEFFPGMGHNMMLEPDWQAVAQRILSWLGEQGL
ncbi:alpha/beta hydrolase [Mycobacterium sp. NPDC051804]|uniref:alpha/beta hydrolase n=1 Tax=Mycobacterium sp. NPDC051804 TaxID=3364295 RepID=UPI0037AE9195